MTKSRTVKKTQKRKSFSKKSGKANSKRAGGSRKVTKKTSKKNYKKQLKRKQMGMGMDTNFDEGGRCAGCRSDNHCGGTGNNYTCTCTDCI